MKIGLIDVDSHNFPNLALMKISTHHKNKGHKVEWYSPMSGLEEIYDIVYMSKVFTDLYTLDYKYPVYATKVIKGGYGYDNYDLPFDGYETTYPDYSIYYDIYPQYKNTAIGYLTRGCPRNCSFCIVSGYEGKKTCQVANLDNFYNADEHNEIRLLDPNILAHKDITVFKQLKNCGAYIHFTGGVDIRFLTKEQANIINDMKVKMLHFAWDNNDNGRTEKEIRQKRDWLKYDRNKVMFYVLVNYETDWEFDLYRVKTLKELNCDPYIMIYNKPICDKKYKRLQRGVNNKYLFWSKNFNIEDYINDKTTFITDINQQKLF